jgi:ASC-1-like (ASCH) protein
MRHELRLHPRPFEKIKAGIKTIEMRLWDDKRRLISIGDTLIFYKRPDLLETLTCTITALHLFPNFTAMCQVLPLDKMGYEGASLAAWKNHQDPGMGDYYSAEEEALWGAVGIEFEVI